MLDDLCPLANTLRPAYTRSFPKPFTRTQLVPLPAPVPPVASPPDRFTDRHDAIADRINAVDWNMGR